MKVWGETEFLPQSNHLKIFSDTKEKKTVTLLSGRYQLNQVIKINTTHNKMYWHHVPSDMKHWEQRITSDVFLPQMHKCNLIIRKYQSNQIGRHSTIWLPILIRRVKVMEERKAWGTVIVWRRLREHTN